RILQKARPRVATHRFVDLKISMSAGATRMHHAFWNSFVIEMGDFFSEDKIFDKGWPARSCLQGVLIVIDCCSLVGRESLTKTVFFIVMQVFELVFLIGW